MRTLSISRPAWAWGRNGELTPHEITVAAGIVPARFPDDPTDAAGVSIHVYSKRGATMGTSPIDIDLTTADALALADAIRAECGIWPPMADPDEPLVDGKTAWERDNA